jgi:hypothetical protein
MFTQQETTRFLSESDFPKFELSYETMTHNKVLDANIILAIPEGNKFYAWFTTYKAENVCFLLEISAMNKAVISCKIVLTSFTDSLSYGNGTVLYGTLFSLQRNIYNKKGLKDKDKGHKEKGNTCFCIEDIYHYKGNSYQNESFLSKLKLIKNILAAEVSQTALTPNYVIFGLPVLNTNFNSLLRDIDEIPYKIENIIFRYFNSKKALYIKYYKPKTSFFDNETSINATNMNATSKNDSVRNAVFLVKPEMQNDIYTLYIYKNGIEEYYDTACIQEYKTSVMMNNLFRNIKENCNLDTLEESDDETEFQNEKEDKFVFLDRSIKMNCVYNVKFKRWMPVSVAARNDRIFSDTTLIK